MKKIQSKAHRLFQMVPDKYGGHIMRRDHVIKNFPSHTKTPGLGSKNPFPTSLHGVQNWLIHRHPKVSILMQPPGCRFGIAHEVLYIFFFFKGALVCKPNRVSIVVQSYESLEPVR